MKLFHINWELRIEGILQLMKRRESEFVVHLWGFFFSGESVIYKMP